MIEELTEDERQMLEEVDNNTSPLNTEEQELLDKVLEEVHQEIPENSKTLLVQVSTSRFSDAIWYEEIQKQTILLAGLGGIGSYVAFMLSRMKPHAIFMYDNDRVEEANMSGQLYGIGDAGNNKVHCLAQMVSNYSDYNNCYCFPELYTVDTTNTADIMICGFDNMSARKVFFNKWLQHMEFMEDKSKCLFIDGRLAAEEFQIFAIQGEDDRAIADYRKKWLFTDRQADETICSYKQTTFCANMIGSMMVNIFVNFIANQCNPLIPRDVPYYTEYNASTMYLKTEA